MSLLEVGASPHSDAGLREVRGAAQGVDFGHGLCTYDVFDTVMTRLVGEPSSMFLLIGYSAVEQALWSGSAAEFAAARLAAEGRARAVACTREIRFSAIYEQLGFAYNLSDKTLVALAACELALESRFLRAVPSIVRQIDRQRAAGSHIAFVSDMYLPQTQIRQWLEERAIARPTDGVWVSSENGRTKGDGSLFNTVAEANGALPARWEHVGDNEWSDVRMARKRGLSARHFVDCHLTDAELSMESASGATGGVSSLFAGASRWTRISAGEMTKVEQRGLNQIAAEVAGPVLYAFVLWVLESAREQGYKTVWFMARDGQVMIPIARSIAAKLGWDDLDIGYLYGGRQVVKLAALTVVDDAAVEWIAGGAGILCLEDVLERVGLQLTESLTQRARSHDLPIEGSIGWAKLTRLSAFLKDPEVAEQICATAARRRSDVLGYFQASGLLGGRCCVVDIGWRGTVAKAIAGLIGPAADEHLFLYFGLFARPKACASLQMRAYLFDHDGVRRRGIGHDIAAITAAMETFCRADHGSVMRLEAVGHGYEPVCRPTDTRESGHWDTPYFQSRIAVFADAVAIDAIPSRRIDLRGLVESRLSDLLDTPNDEQARLLGSVGFVDDQAGGAPQPLAHGYQIRDVARAFASGGWPTKGLNWWLPGARAMTPKPIQISIRIAGKIGRLTRRLKRAASDV